MKLSQTIVIVGMTTLLFFVFISLTSASVFAETSEDARISRSGSPARGAIAQFGDATAQPTQVIRQEREEDRPVKLHVKLKAPEMTESVSEIVVSEESEVTTRVIKGGVLRVDSETGKIVIVEDAQEVRTAQPVYSHPETGAAITSDEYRVYLEQKIAEVKLAIQVASRTHMARNERNLVSNERNRGARTLVLMTENPLHFTPPTPVVEKRSMVDRDAMLLEIRQRIIAIQADIDYLLKKQVAVEAEMRSAKEMIAEKKEMKREYAPVVEKRHEKKEEKKEKKISVVETSKMKEKELVVEKTETLQKEGLTPSMLVTSFIFVLILLILGTPFFMRKREEKLEQEENNDTGENPWNRS